MAWDDCYTERDYDRYMGYSGPRDEDPANITPEAEPEQRPEVGPREVPF